MDETVKSANQVGFYSSLAVAILTLVTFGFAIVAVPISGANCLEGCIDYPYLDTVAQFPKDYRWMPLASLLMLVYVVWTAALHALAAPHKKIFSQVGLVFASMAALILVSDYFLQFSVVPISLMSGEIEGITLLTQYNAHGIFIALEELGYLLMALSFAFMALALANRSRLETAARWVFASGFGLAVIALTAFSVLYGLDRQDRFEVVVISIDWLVLLVNGTLFSVLFGRIIRTNNP
ncbi:MAG: hypothetical protein MUE67_09955 [Anaerolineales bacterium]|nr:hypothetical protein [Anaerolineales bacterium]